ncbi:MAG: hypothetical protein ACOYMH_11845 [Zwartia sp.]|jgi:hypothetical protein
MRYLTASKVSKILKKYLRWFVVLLGSSLLTFVAQRTSPLAHDPQGASYIQQAGLVNPSLQLVYLAFANGSATRSVETQRWRRELVLALEKRRAKRQARLMLKTASYSLLPLALLKAGAR